MTPRPLTVYHALMKIDILPILADNFIYILSEAGEAAVIDPGAATAVQHILRLRRLRLSAVILTHGHGDHIAGAAPLKAATGCAVIGPADSSIAGLDREVLDGDDIAVPGGRLRVMATPGHLPHHVAYHDPVQGALFCGDTLFAGGCGRIMGCTAATLWESLCKLRELPPETQVYCGHEYTVDNLAFAADLEPANPAVAQRLATMRALASSGRPTVPSTIGEELATNPFLRADTQALRTILNLPDAPAAEVFAEIRRRKDAW
ncbi:MAG: hydroxyacylglutathione hydrolase [Lentisphaerae bacterium]|nr:hydroxyacylglutathione hydrolase [Lentisphaerota bacterium]